MRGSFVRVLFRIIADNLAGIIINTLGLSVGISATLYIYLYISDELQFDKFHHQYERIYKVVDRFNFTGEIVNSAVISAPMGPVMAATFPEIESCVRIVKTGGIISPNETNHFEVDRILIADSGFFQVFDFRLEQGNPTTVLNTPNSLVLTTSLAQQLFGNEDPIGKVVALSMFGGTEVTIQGIAADAPSNSHIQYDCILSHATLNGKVKSLDNWLVYGTHTYVLLRPGSDPAAISNQLNALVSKYIGEDLASKYGHYLTPVENIHLGIKRRSELEAGGSVVYVKIFIGVAILVILIASINYISFFTILAIKRAKEIEVRRLFGSGLFELVIRFVLESIFLTTLAIFISIGILTLMLDSLNTVTGKYIAIQTVFSQEILILSILIVVIISIFAGWYPATTFIRQPIQALRQTHTNFPRVSFFRKILVTFQLFVLILLVISMSTVWSQLRYLTNADMGFNPQNKLVLKINSSLVTNHRISLMSKLQELESVQYVGSSSTIPFKSYGYGPFRMNDWPEDENGIFHTMVIDSGFMHALNLHLISGRELTASKLDSTSFILNEAAVKALGFSYPDEVIGKELLQGSAGTNIDPIKRGLIIGVVKNFNYKSLHTEIEPLVLATQKNGYGYIIMNLQENVDQTLLLNKVMAIWKELEPSIPFTFFYLGQEVKRQYGAEESLAKIVSYFCAMAVIISGLGLFSLVAHTTRRRIKELGIRKVLGADIFSLFTLIAKDFVILVLVSIFIALLCSQFLLQWWLNGFVFKVSISSWVYLRAVFLAFVLTYLAVMIQLGLVIRLDPVKTLRRD